ncbi:hypothetical protein N8Z24_00340 [bacterium]|nr:hypothetical protein [bacterium]
MKFFVVGDSKDVPVAVVFHDYSTSEFIVRSSIESFRLAFNAAAQGYFGNTYRRDGGKLFLTSFGPEFPVWSKKVLNKACSGHWKIIKEDELPIEETVDSIVLKFL